jgi:hypothetical protein
VVKKTGRNLMIKTEDIKDITQKLYAIAYQSEGKPVSWFTEVKRVENSITAAIAVYSDIADAGITLKKIRQETEVETLGFFSNKTKPKYPDACIISFNVANFEVV